MPITFRRKPGRRDRGSRKTESLTLRLDAKTKFQLDLVSRVRGESITAFIQAQARTAAEELRFSREGFGQYDWSVFWHPHEGVRAVLWVLLSKDNLTNEERLLREFVDAHREFFLQSSSRTVGDSSSLLPQPAVSQIEALWPRLGEFVEAWETTRLREPEKVRTEMQLLLAEAEVRTLTKDEEEG